MDGYPSFSLSLTYTSRGKEGVGSGPHGPRLDRGGALRTLHRRRPEQSLTVGTAWKLVRFFWINWPDWMIEIWPRPSIDSV